MGGSLKRQSLGDAFGAWGWLLAYWPSPKPSALRLPPTSSAFLFIAEQYWRLVVVFDLQFVEIHVVNVTAVDDQAVPQNEWFFAR